MLVGVPKHFVDYLACDTFSSTIARLHAPRARDVVFKTISSPRSYLSPGLLCRGDPQVNFFKCNIMILVLCLVYDSTNPMLEIISSGTTRLLQIVS